MPDRYSISMLVPGIPFDGDTVKTKSLGGSESAGYYMARELVKLGHRVRVFSNTDKSASFDGVVYTPLTRWGDFITSTYHDVTIVQRTPRAFMTRSCGKLNYLWCHDMALGRQREEFRGVLWNVDRVIVLSEWMKQQYQRVYDLQDELLFKSSNGVDLSSVPSPASKRDHKRLVFSARPERGLDVLLDRILPPLLSSDPEITVALFGYDNPVDHLRGFYAELGRKAAAFGDRVRFVGQLSKEELYREYSASGVYVYPTPSPVNSEFNEIFCISAVEAQACGMPIVASNKGALPETVGKDSGILIDGNPMSDEYRDEFVSSVRHLLDNDEFYQQASAKAREHAANYGWGVVAKQWSNEFERAFEERNESAVRRAHYFYRNNDVFAAQHALEGDASLAALELRNKIAREYNWTKSPKTIKLHYFKGGRETDKRLSNIPIEQHQLTQSGETRFHALQRAISELPDTHNILDFGCGHGWSTLYFASNIPDKKWTGVDIDPGAVKWACRFRDHLKLDPTQVTFLEGTDSFRIPEGSPKFDLAILSEVLEHCVDPIEALRHVERQVRTGGHIIITVPYGPSEYGTPNWNDFRNHLWHFEDHDIEEMLGNKTELNMNAVFDHSNDKTGEPVGFHLITYTVKPGEPIVPYDMARKQRLQRPRQTMSVTMIAGAGAEETMRWSLNSMKWIADEIVIGDTGLTRAGLEIAHECGAKVVPASDPKQSGFDVPRNQALVECQMDWVFWIDSDERLYGGEFLTKYLRQSPWWGLAIRQHHFAVDASFSPDVPVRLFRRGTHKNGKKMNFYGRIHEHPELGLNDGPGDVLITSDLHIAHVGYMHEVGRRGRFIRNFPLLEKDKIDYPNRLLQKHFVMRDLMLLNVYELQQNGNVITDSVRQRAEEVVALYREHFLGKHLYANIDGLQYYSEALRILQRGVDVAFNFMANKDGQGDPINGHAILPTVARYDTPEEAHTDIAFRMKQKLDPLTPRGLW